MHLLVVVTKKISASGDKNEAMNPLLLVLVSFKFYFCDKFGKGNLELLKLCRPGWQQKN